MDVVLTDSQMEEKFKSIEERLEKLNEKSSTFAANNIDTLIKNAQYCLKVLKNDNIQIRDLKTLSRRFTAAVKSYRDDVATFVGLAGLRASSSNSPLYTEASEKLTSGNLIGAAMAINGQGTPSLVDKDLVAAMESIQRSLHRVEVILPSFLLTELQELEKQTGLVQIEQSIEDGGIVPKFNTAKKIGYDEVHSLEKRVAMILQENAVNLLSEEVERISSSMEADQGLFAEQNQNNNYFNTLGQNQNNGPTPNR